MALAAATSAGPAGEQRKAPAARSAVLPWQPGTRPLMLAPMQGLTNSALRQCFLDHFAPDVVFTEFVRVQTQARKRIARADLAEVRAHSGPTPLVVQLIGNHPVALAEAAARVQDAGVGHINVNLGCPYGRMTTGATGGELLRRPDLLEPILLALRRACHGSFSIKWRAGYDDLEQWNELLPLFEGCGADFLILHPRTVVQRYSGQADHRLTARVVERTSLPVIANGDIGCPAMGRELLVRDGAAGLMLGRGALSDPWLFQRIRTGAVQPSAGAQRRRDIRFFLTDLWPRYLEKFCGERQALMKIKDVLNFIAGADLQRDLGKLKRANSHDQFCALLERFFPI
ncbi:MAG: tRNA-dihydrouridine synthase family protein [Pelovirga sp.]